MAKTSLIMKQQRPPKFKSRAYTLKGEVPGVIKASW